MTVSRRGLLATAAGAAAAFPGIAANAVGPQVLRIGMTAADLPTTHGIPNNGGEGFRFLGYPAYDSVVNWDFTHTDKLADITPGLFTAWRIDEGNPLRWICDVRQGVKFHDGSDFTADSVMFNFGRLFDEKSPQYDAPAAPIVRATVSMIDRFEKADDKTIVITTKFPFSFLPYLLTRILIVSPAQWEATGKNWAAFAKSPAGTGPFKITKVVLGQYAEMSRNEAYWDKARIPKLEKMIVYPMPEATTRVAALRSGQVDWIEVPPPDSIPSLKAAGLQISLWPYPYALNCTDTSPFKDERVRQAINYAIDREGMCAMLNGTAKPAAGLYPPGDPMFGSPKNHYKYDPEKARALLKEAGYGPNKPLKAKIMISTSGSGQMVPIPMNEFMQQNFKDVGMDIDFDVVEWGTMLVAVRSDPKSAPSHGDDGVNISLSFTDPSSMFRYYSKDSFSPVNYNWGHWDNQAATDLLKKARATFNKTEQEKLLADAHGMVVDGAPWLFIVHDLNPRAMSKKVTGFRPAQSWYQDYPDQHGMRGVMLRRDLLAGIATSAALPAFPAFAVGGGTLRVAMTAADLPTAHGIPNNGFEGFRFLGYPPYDGLVNWDLRHNPDKPADITPGLFTAWKIDEANPLRWLFTVRQGVKFHDGSDFNADAVIWNLRRVYDDKAPHYDAPAAPIVKAAVSMVDTYEKVDDSTIAMTTKYPFSFLPYLLTRVLMVSPAQYEIVGKSWAEFGKKPSGTGPFKITRVLPGQYIEMVRNDNYWDKERIPKLDKLVVSPMAEATTRIAALRSGQMDWIEVPAPDSIPSLKAAGYNVTLWPYPHTWPYVLNTEEGSAFNDVRVRQAANYAIDREGLCSLLNGVAKPAVGLYPPGHPLFGNPTQKYSYDPAKAKALLAAAGYGPNKPAKAKIMISTSGSGQMLPIPMNEFLQQNLAAVGLQIDFDVVEWGTMLVAIRSDPKAPQSHGVQGINISLSSVDPSTMFRYYAKDSFSPTNYNWGHWDNAEVTGLLKKAQASFDVPEQTKILAEAHGKIVDEATWLFIVHDLNPRAMSKKVQGFVPVQSWFIDFTQISMVT